MFIILVEKGNNISWDMEDGSMVEIVYEDEICTNDNTDALKEVKRFSKKKHGT